MAAATDGAAAETLTVATVGGAAVSCVGGGEVGGLCGGEGWWRGRRWQAVATAVARVVAVRAVAVEMVAKMVAMAV